MNDLVEMFQKAVKLAKGKQWSIRVHPWAVPLWEEYNRTGHLPSEEQLDILTVYAVMPREIDAACDGLDAFFRWVRA